MDKKNRSLLILNDLKQLMIKHDIEIAEVRNSIVIFSDRHGLDIDMNNGLITVGILDNRIEEYEENI